MKSVIDYVADAIRSPREQLSRGQHYLRHLFELVMYCWRQLERHRAEGMAAELTYRTIFALIPVVVLGLVMFRIFGGLDEVQSQVENQLYSFFGVPDIPEGYVTPTLEAVPEDPSTEGESAPDDTAIVSQSVTASETSPQPSAGEEEATPGEEVVDVDEAIRQTAEEQEQKQAEAQEESRREARASIRRTLRSVTAKVSSLDFKSIGAFGLILFIYAAVALADSVEHLFNRIFEAPSQRPIHIRVAIHWSIITLGSGLLALSLYMSGQVVEWFVSIGVGGTVRYILTHLLSIAASWVLLFLLYALMPNTHVSLRAAVIGSLVGSLLWEGAKFGFQIYVAKAVPYSAIYGSIGLIPLFLFWIYVTWLIVLFGLILTYTLQSLRGRPLRDRGRDIDQTPTGDPDWMVPIMCEVAHEFEQGTSIDEQELADRLGLASRTVKEMSSQLVGAGLLRRVKAGVGESDMLTLGRPSEKITIQEILLLAHQTRPTNQHPAWQTLAGLKEAERTAADNKTLADV